MADGLIAFLSARLDEAESTARATSRPAWRKWGVEPWYDGEFLNDGRTERADLWGAAGAGLFTAQGALATVMADHIALHDPASTLRDIDADRKLIAAYENVAEYSDPWIGLDLAVRIRAERFSDHPGYRPEWKPS